jgi:hypothetical protein
MNEVVVFRAQWQKVVEFGRTVVAPPANVMWCAVVETHRARRSTPSSASIWRTIEQTVYLAEPEEVSDNDPICDIAFPLG